MKEGGDDKDGCHWRDKMRDYHKKFRVTQPPIQSTVHTYLTRPIDSHPNVGYLLMSWLFKYATI